MDELLVGSLGLIAEVCFEAGVEIASEALASLSARASSRLYSAISEIHPVTGGFALGMFGALVGFLSVIVYPHPFVHPSRFHGISVIVSPLITGFVMSRFGRLLRKHGRRATPFQTFGYGFLFAFAISLMRFLMLK